MENQQSNSNSNSRELLHLTKSEMNMKYICKYLAKGPRQSAVTSDPPAQENIFSRLNYSTLSENGRIPTGQ